MLAKRKNIILSVFFIALAALACNMPGGAPPTAVPTNTAVDTATPTFTVTETPSPTITATACLPSVTTNTVANVRSGPGQVYGVIGSIPMGGIAKVAGKNIDSTWWYIEFAGGNGGYAWIAGSVTSASCIPETLAFITAPPTPIVPTSPPAAVEPTTVPGLLIVIPPLLWIKSPTPTLALHLIYPNFPKP
jgi:hypothetical protein